MDLLQKLKNLTEEYCVSLVHHQKMENDARAFVYRRVTADLVRLIAEEEANK